MSEYKKLVIEDRRLSISAPNPNVKGKYATLNVAVFKGSPSIVLRTGDPSEANQEKNWGKIEARMDLATFMVAMELLRDVIANPQPGKHTIECKNHPKSNGGQRSFEPVHVSNLIIGRNQSGVVYMTVVDVQDSSTSRRIAIPLTLPNSRYHRLVGADGQPLGAVESSNLAARALVNLWSKLVPKICHETYEPPAPAGNRQGGNRQGGYQQRQGGGQGGYQQRQAPQTPATSDSGDYGDDIPF